jgi:hypothetical protein
MGSHGGATAEGQASVLAHLGVTEESVGAPIRATMETVEYGATLHGIPCRFDKNAAEADAVLCINRVKSHTSFDRPIESGLTKLIAVGLGKQVGAERPSPPRPARLPSRCCRGLRASRSTTRRSPMASPWSRTPTSSWW